MQLLDCVLLLLCVQLVAPLLISQFCVWSLFVFSFELCWPKFSCVCCVPPNLQSYLQFNPSLPFHLNVACVALSRMWTSTVENWQTADVAEPLSLFNWLYLSAQHKYDLTLRERMKNRQNSLRFRFWSWRCGDFVSSNWLYLFSPRYLLPICSGLMFVGPSQICLLSYHKYKLSCHSEENRQTGRDLTVFLFSPFWF